MYGHTVLLNLLGGVALLIWGINMIKTGVLGSFGPELRRGLASATHDRIRAAAAGLGAAAVLQSSTAAAMLLATFVGRGLIGLAPALAMMLGADLGTTLVVQALAFDLSALVPLLLVVGVATALGASGDRVREVGRITLGFGLMILALALIGGATAPLRDSPVVEFALSRLAADPVLAVLVAAVLTWLFHSSVAFVLFVASLTGAGLVPAGLAIVLVLGANIGAGLIPLGLTLRDTLGVRRTLYGNLGFRLIGAALVLPFASALNGWMEELAGDPARQVATAHTLFNAMLIAVFLR
jgi:phosphate:Na+ symporter